MAGTSLLTLIDDIASTLDDVAVLTKVAAKKTSGVLGDDLALNAKQVAGVSADRELPVVWAVAKGSSLNKLILVPSALLISSFIPFLVGILLILGGLYLCFEGFEKVFEKLIQRKSKSVAPVSESVDLPKFEKEKIKGAIRTDFILSAEIIVITLGTVATEPLLKQFLVLAGISIVMTIGVYGLVAGIVKLDDLGLFLYQEKNHSISRWVGAVILKFAPLLMKFLGIAGTIAMFLVGGGILTHEISFLHHMLDGLSSMLKMGADLLIGLIAGGIIVGLIHIFKKPTHL